jgi:hypothetical protein
MILGKTQIKVQKSLNVFVIYLQFYIFFISPVMVSTFYTFYGLILAHDTDEKSNNKISHCMMNFTKITASNVHFRGVTRVQIAHKKS